MTEKNKRPVSGIFPKLSSFRWAAKGLAYLFRREVNARFHLVASVLVVAAGFIFSINTVEWLFITVAIVMVVAAEAFNTAVEMLVDKVSPEFNQTMGRIKDVAAAGVLITAIGAAAIGIIIFAPKIF